MLVLTRKLMERLYIGDDVCVTVVRLEGGQVRLGIEAPRDVSVVRAELVPEREAAAGRPARPVRAVGEARRRETPR
jgi:carbon storage regulator